MSSEGRKHHAERGENSVENVLILYYYTIPMFNDPEKEAFEHTVGKGENASNQHFLLFLQCYLLFPSIISNFGLHLFCPLQMLSILTGLKFCHLVKS